MKAVHIELSSRLPKLPFPDLLAEAKALETAGDLKGASAAYLQCLRLRPLSEFCYHRLMILYRKQKLYAKEAAIIRRGIKAFETLQKGKKRRNTAVETLSKKLLKSTGLIDAKGNSTFSFQPVEKWSKRLMLLQKRYLSK